MAHEREQLRPLPPVAFEPSLVDLRRRLEGILPRVDLPDLILEVMAWHPGFVAASAGTSGGRSRLGDRHVTIAASLTAHALNVGYVPVIFEGVPPDVIISDTGSYSDIVFALIALLGFDYRPQLADLPDAKLWRILIGADYGALDAAARGKIDLAGI